MYVGAYVRKCGIRASTCICALSLGRAAVCWRYHRGRHSSCFEAAFHTCNSALRLFKFAPLVRGGGVELDRPPEG